MAFENVIDISVRVVARLLFPQNCSGEVNLFAAQLLDIFLVKTAAVNLT